MTAYKKRIDDLKVELTSKEAEVEHLKANLGTDKTEEMEIIVSKSKELEV